MKPPTKDPRQRRHSTATMALARRMYGDGDSWTPTQIVRYLAEVKSIDVSLNTIRLWVIPGMADEHRARNIASHRRRRTTRKPTPAPSSTPILDRMLKLRDARLPFTSIAKVLNLDYNLHLTPEQTRYYINTRREPKLPKKKAGLT